MDERPTQNTQRAGGAGGGSGRRAAAMRRRQWLLGLGATLIVLALQGVGALDKLVIELWSLDRRATWFGRSSLAPSPELAVVAIDDRAIEVVGRWPWDRQRLAQAIDELTRAGASVVALDVLLDEPQRARWVLDEPQEGALPPDAGAVRRVDDDALLAAAMRRHGRTVLATNFALARAGSERAAAPRAVTSGSVLSALRRQPELIHAEEPAALATLAEELLGEEDLRTDRGFAREALRDRWRSARAMLAKEPASALHAQPAAARWPRSPAPVLPAAEFAEAAARLANVTVSQMEDADGKVRRVPVLVEHGEKLWPVLGVSAVALHRNVDVAEIQIGPRGLSLPAAAGERSLPLMRERIRGRAVDGLHFLTWPRATESWLAQFQPAGGADAGSAAVSVSMVGVLNPVLVAERVAANVRRLDQWTRAAVGAQVLTAEGYAGAAAGLSGASPGEDEWASLLKALRPYWETLAADAASFLEMIGDDQPETEEDRQMVALLSQIAEGFPRLLREVDEGLASIDAQRARLAELLGGRICFVGFASTAAAVDVVGTSIHPRTPGVYVHTAVANALLTGMARQPAPLWGNLLAVGALGVLGTFVGVRGTVLTGPLAVALLIVLWFVLAAMVFWDAMWLVVAVTGPGLAAAGGWLAVMLHRLLVEQRARRRTEDRFRSYVSPAVVDILVNNPELDSMAPQRRELTVMFTDLAGFTTTAERLGTARTAKVLARYLGAMTEALQSTGATLDKYLGDGVMAFWGAPIADPEHARHACRAVLEMTKMLRRLNDEGAFGEGERLEMRIGLAAGELMVGDFGNPPHNSSYTVIGDAANLAARLESANKQLGTGILVSGRVRELVLGGGGGNGSARGAAGEGGRGAEFLFRPLGRLAVKGKLEAEEVYELIDSRTKGDRTREWIDLTRAAVSAYQDGDLEGALGAFERLEREFGEGKLAEVYRRSIESRRNLAAAGADREASAGFDGTIHLTEK